MSKETPRELKELLEAKHSDATLYAVMNKYADRRLTQFADELKGAYVAYQFNGVMLEVLTPKDIDATLQRYIGGEKRE